MSESPTPSQPPEIPGPRPRLSWPAVMGFGILGLLWPLLRLIGLEAVVGGVTTVMVAFLATFVIWVLGAGFGHVPRPVLTLTLSGVLFALLLGATTVAIGDWPDHGIGLNLVAATIEIGRSAGFGALSGLVAESIQRARRRRRRNRPSRRTSP
ncbi:hypothetical protein [Microbacterium sp. K41]|uniref:hypothetical protein n=1 Tax=Microbacterium sp. K41 TaxID=2305437 RepID=UPI00109C93BC|nr:hypothetical protein [Microbacterium sp. K41]